LLYGVRIVWNACRFFCFTCSKKTAANIFGHEAAVKHLRLNMMELLQPAVMRADMAKQSQAWGFFQMDNLGRHLSSNSSVAS
jgi:hypothetical protein